MSKAYLINGFFKDDGEEFSNYIVVDTHDTPRGYNDEDIFYYGITSLDLYDGDMSDFVITSYKEIA